MFFQKTLYLPFIKENLKRKTLNFIITRLKYDQYAGVKGVRNRKHFYGNQHQQNLNNNHKMGTVEENDEKFNLEDTEYDLMASGVMHINRKLTEPQNVFIIQPYVKWGPQRNLSFSPDEQLQEAETLIRSLPNWGVALSLKVPLESLERKTLFGKGKLEELKALVRELRNTSTSQTQPLSCIFISKGTLSFIQKSILQNIFNVPVMDRYSVVIQILRLHATSAEARIQVAMAEIPYIWSQAREANVSQSSKWGYTLNDVQKDILRARERKLKQELERIKMHRKLLRNKRKKQNYPIIAVVGYTNAGKTSLIKALTQEEKLQPQNRLFATLDVTTHVGYLPCNMQVVFMDTVGFISDIPTGLIECFVATLEDALLADVILHVQDVSHSCYISHKEHVENTLKLLTQTINYHYKEEAIKLPFILNVANKIDLIKQKQEDNESQSTDDLVKISCKTLHGFSELLNNLEHHVLRITCRKKMTIRVQNGGNEIAWLYKNTAVIGMQPDETNVAYMLVDVVITDLALQQFKRQFFQ